MKSRILSVCGALATSLYVVTVALGGAIRLGYSHFAQAVSELIETGAPNKSLLDALFIFYNLLMELFDSWKKSDHRDWNATYNRGRQLKPLLTL